MAAIVAMVGGLPRSGERKDDDFFDRLNHKYTVSLLTIFSIIVTTSQYVGDRIFCWIDAHFSDGWSDYVHSYCWVKNTYYLDLEEHIPKEHEEEKRATLAYYQWVPLILLSQAMLFVLPCLLWRAMNGRSGVDINSIMRLGKRFQQTEEASNRKKHLNTATVQMARFLGFRKEKNKSCNCSVTYFCSRFICPCVGRNRGNYLITSYLFVKVLYIANVVAQLFLLSFMFGGGFHMYGIEAIQAWVSGSDIAETKRFPRVTMCDFKIRRLGNLQRYTTQCVLPINLFHEKIYLIVWFWMVMVLVCNVFSLIAWVMQSAYALDRHRFIKNHMRIAERQLFKKDRNRLIKFTEEVLAADGVFILRLLQGNTDLVTASDVISDLWDFYNNDKDRDEDNPRGIDLLNNIPMRETKA